MTIVRRGLLLLLLFLTACGSVGQAAAPAATATPPFQRYSANDVQKALYSTGLRADPPVPTGADQLPQSPFGGSAFTLWSDQSAPTSVLMVVIFNAQSDMAAWQNYFVERSKGPFIRYRYQIHGNAMLVFRHIVTANNPQVPEYSQFWAVFAAMP